MSSRCAAHIALQRYGGCVGCGPHSWVETAVMKACGAQTSGLLLPEDDEWSTWCIVCVCSTRRIVVRVGWVPPRTHCSLLVFAEASPFLLLLSASHISFAACCSGALAKMTNEGLSFYSSSYLAIEGCTRTMLSRKGFRSGRQQHQQRAAPAAMCLLYNDSCWVAPPLYDA